MVALVGCGARTDLDAPGNVVSDTGVAAARDGRIDLDPTIPDGSPALDGGDAAFGDGDLAFDGGDVLLPPGCGPALPVYDGLLCGPPERPCRILADETVAGGALRAAAPAVALDPGGSPHMLFSGAFVGHYARREADGAWRVEPIPPSLLRGSLTIAVDGTAYALVEPGLGGVMSLWQRRVGRWEHVDDLGDYAQLGGSLLRSRDGCLHAVLVRSGTDDPRPVYGLYAATGWTFEPLPPLVDSWGTAYPSITLARGGDPHFAYHYFAGPGRGRELWWVAHGGSGERIGIDDGPGGGGPTPIAVTEEPDGLRVYVFHVPRDRHGDLDALVVSIRSPAGGWSDAVVDRWPPGCSDPDTVCRFTPYVALSSGAGDVRLLYVLTRHHRFGGPTAELRLASLSRVRVDVGTVLPAAPGSAGSLSLMVQAVLDAEGRMHIALTQSTRVVGESAVRYMLLGP